MSKGSLCAAQIRKCLSKQQGVIFSTPHKAPLRIVLTQRIYAIDKTKFTADAEALANCVTYFSFIVLLISLSVVTRTVALRATHMRRTHAPHTYATHMAQ